MQKGLNSLAAKLPSRRSRRANAEYLTTGINAAVGNTECGTCTACCVAFTIRKLMKPEGIPCAALKTSGPNACKRYATRPKECRSYFCLWRIGIPIFDRPDKCGIVFNLKDEGFAYIEGMAQSVDVILRNVRELEELRTAAEMLVVVRISGSNEVRAFGSKEQLAAIQATYENRRRRALKVLP